MQGASLRPIPMGGTDRALCLRSSAWGSTQTLRPQLGVVGPASAHRWHTQRRGAAAMSGEQEVFYRRRRQERVPPPSPSPQSLPSADTAFVERLQLAWNALFPTDTPKSVAQIAKARLRRVLSSDRMAVNPALKNQLCNNIVNSMAEFVIVNKQKEVEFAVHRSPDTGSVYMVKVPVQRVKPDLQLEFQEQDP